jgi:hypothetical protein
VAAEVLEDPAAQRVAERLVPRVPVRLYAASGDVNVPVQNAGNCRAALGVADVGLIDLGTGTDHTGSVHTALPRILSWFERRSPARRA